jgi:ribosome assembly protein 3
MSQTSGADTQNQFSSLYLQRVTKELAEDLDKVRNADDFKADSISFLIHALQQGSAQFSSKDQRRVVSEVEGQTEKKQ